MGGPVDVPGDQLRTIVERIEHIEKEIQRVKRRQEGNLSRGEEQRLRS